MDQLPVKKGPFQRLKMTLGVVALIILAACTKVEDTGSTATRTSEDHTIQIVTTTGMITDITKMVGGDEVEVSGLMGPGVDPHLYKASHGDMEKMSESDIILYGGLHLEGKLTDILEKLAKQKPVVPVSKNIERSLLRSGLDSGGTEYDPHIWFNVKHWISATETVRDVLVQYDAVNKEKYENNAAAYIKELQELDAEVTEKIGQIPEDARVLVTAHDAFGYFGDAYGMKVMGLQGISTASEYGSKDVSELRDFLVKNKIKAVFVESSIPTKSMEAVIAGAKQLGHEVTIGGELYSDSMGEPGSDADTYIKMVRHNVNTIVDALK